MKEKMKVSIGMLVFLLFDQLTKFWAVAVLKDGGPISLIPGVLEFRYVENRGAAFGILQNRQWIFLLLGAAVLILFAVFVPKLPKEKHFLWLKLVLFFVAAGAIGNMIDRVWHGYVVDFIYFRLIDFPVFNVADIYVTCAAVAMVLLVMFYYSDEDFEKIFPKKVK